MPATVELSVPPLRKHAGLPPSSWLGHRVAQQAAELVAQGRRTRRLRGSSKRGHPVGRDGQPAVLEPRAVAGRQAVHALEDGARRRDGVEVQVVEDGLRVELGAGVGQVVGALGEAQPAVDDADSTACARQSGPPPGKLRPWSSVQADREVAAGRRGGRAGLGFAAGHRALPRGRGAAVGGALAQIGVVEGGLSGQQRRAGLGHLVGGGGPVEGRAAIVACKRRIPVCRRLRKVG